MMPALERRILVVAPTGSDGRNTVSVLQQANLQAECFGNVSQAVEEAARGCGVLLLTEEALTQANRSVLGAMLATQPKWSNVPLILITSRGSKPNGRDARKGFDPKVHVALLERPLRASTLLSSVEAALGYREKQYEIRNLWEEREKMLSSLEERVRERTSKLQSLVQEMEAFSYGVSHDLRAPLRVLYGYADVVIEDYADSLPAEGHRLLEKISKAAKRMDRLTQDLLAYTRIASGEITLDCINLDMVLDEVIESYPILQENSDRIKVIKPLGTCLGHAPSLEQCFSNLLENAVKYARPGEAPSIEVFSIKRNGRLQISVVDQGIEISPGDRERIFELFERAGNHVPGAGIGLALVKKCVERMNGTVGLSIVHGSHKKFWIELAECPP